MLLALLTSLREQEHTTYPVRQHSGSFIYSLLSTTKLYKETTGIAKLLTVFTGYDPSERDENYDPLLHHTYKKAGVIGHCQCDIISSFLESTTFSLSTDSGGLEIQTFPIMQCRVATQSREEWKKLPTCSLETGAACECLMDS